MPDAVDLGDVPVPGTFFVKKDKKHRFNKFRPPRSAKRQDLEFCYTYPYCDSSNLKSRLIKLIKAAEKKIFITSFLLGDNDLIEAITDAAKRLRGGVYVITAIDENSLRRGLEEYDHDSDLNEQTTKKQLSGLTRQGVYVRGHSRCHAKFAVIDDKVAYISTANFEHRAFTKNCECALLVRDAKEVRRLAVLFGHLWFAGCDYELEPKKRKYTVTSRAMIEPEFKLRAPSSVGDTGTIWTNGEDHNLLAHIHDILGSAKSKILLATYSLKGLDDSTELLFDPLRAAIESNGVEAKILIRGRNYPEQRRLARELIEMGVEVYPHSWNHAKCAIADGSRGAVFSANFDKQHGLTNGVEVGFRLDPAEIEPAAHYFEHAMENADRVVMENPEHRTLNERMGMSWHSEWPWADKIKVEMIDTDWERLLDGIGKLPIIFRKEDSRSATLYAGRSKFRFSVKRRDRAEISFMEEIEKGRDSLEQLERWIRRHKGPKRGFCPAKLVRTG